MKKTPAPGTPPIGPQPPLTAEDLADIVAASPDREALITDVETIARLQSRTGMLPRELERPYLDPETDLPASTSRISKELLNHPSGPVLQDHGNTHGERFPGRGIDASFNLAAALADGSAIPAQLTERLPSGLPGRVDVLEQEEMVEKLAELLRQCDPQERKRVSAKAMRQLRNGENIDITFPNGTRMQLGGSADDRAKLKNEFLDGEHGKRASITPAEEERIYKEAFTWLEGVPAVLQAPNGTQQHKFIEAFKAGKVFVPYTGRKSYNLDQAPIKTATAFVVEHNWAAAFKGAGDFDTSEWRLPFPDCWFEFRINGKRIGAMLSDTRSPIPNARPNYDVQMIPIIAFDAGWVMPMTYGLIGNNWTPIFGMDEIEDEGAKGLITLFQDHANLMGDAIRAVAIGLDAEVVTTETVRAPHKLNHQRVKNGKLPIGDYHVVQLNRRTRPTRLEPVEGADPRNSPRLHFRRGHWRHYENHKTWIRPMLVGNPDLGFIDKHYRL